MAFDEVVSDVVNGGGGLGMVTLVVGAVVSLAEYVRNVADATDRVGCLRTRCAAAWPG